MSFQAMKWVADQKAGSPSAKSVLYALANYANFEGGCFASLDRLADDSEQSRASVIRRLAELEARGLIYRGTARRKGDGRHAGEFTTCMTFLLMDTISIGEALRHGYDPENQVRCAQNDENSDAGENEQENPACGEITVVQSATRPNDAPSENNGLGDATKGHGVADCNTVISGHGGSDCNSARVSPVQHEPINREPITLLKPPALSPAAVLEDDSWHSSWRRVESLWPWTGSDAPHRVREKIRTMDPDERLGVVPAVEAYLADCRAKSKPPASARGFFGSDAWRDWALKARGRKGKDVGAPVFVFKGTPAWNAWAAYRGETPEKMYAVVIKSQPGKPGKQFPTLYPPGAERTEEAQQDQGDVR